MVMKLAGIKKPSLLAFALALLVGCSSDPNVRKLKYLQSGEKYFSQGKLNEAIIEFRNALEIDPRFVTARYQLARVYLSSKNPQAAYRELQETVTLDPNNTDAQLELASLFVASR